eukprot:s573_g10.t1
MAASAFRVSDPSQRTRCGIKMVPAATWYIHVPDIGELADEHEQHSVYLRNARGIEATLETTGFELRKQATECTNFFDSSAVATIYYPEVEALVRHCTGCGDVIVFDHTIRESGATGLNVLSETTQAAAPVLRVHTDYTHDSAPRRVRDLVRSESYTGTKLSEENCDQILNSRYCFINVWKSIAEEPALRCPLAVCDAKSVDYSKAIKYEMHFPDRIGSNYALEFSPEHKWYYYPRMGKDESLLFKFAPAMKQVLESHDWCLPRAWKRNPPAQATVSFIAAPGKHRPDELNAERLISQLPPPLKKHLWLKTPNFRRKLAGQAQQLIDAAIQDDPENMQMIKAAIQQGVENLNHEADLHPLEFQQSLKDLERIERALKVHSMEHAFCFSWIWLPATTKRRSDSVLRAFL